MTNLRVDGVDSLDAEQNTYGSDWNTGVNFANVAKYGGGDVRWAANFDISSIGSDHTIDDAYLWVAFGSVGTDLSIRVVEEADHTFPANYGASTTAVSNWSSNSVTWSPTGGGGSTNEESPDITTLIEDCITAGGAVGEIGLWMEGVTSSVTVCYLYGYTNYYEYLIINHTEPAGGPSIAVVQHHRQQQGVGN